MNIIIGIIRKKQECLKGIIFGILYHFINALIYLMLYSFYSLFTSTVALVIKWTFFSLIMIFSLFIYLLIKGRKWEILKGFFIGCIIIPLVLFGLLIGLFFLIMFLWANS